MRFKSVLAPALLFVLFGTLLVQLPLAIADRTSEYEWFDPVVDVRRILLDRYVVPPDEEALQRAMIDAMVDLLDDPYTQYIPPADLPAFNKILRGTYAGIGAEVNLEDGYLTIVSPMDDSPALMAGIMAGDVVLEIEGESTLDMGLTRCVELLTGEPGTDVTVRVRHLDSTEEEIAITRAHIVTRTVRGLRRQGETWSYCVDEELDLSYIRITQFNASTVDEFRAALETLQADGLGGLLLDLRDNPGGALPTAVAMADLFLDGGTIVSVRSSDAEETVFTAKAPETLPDFPMVVLVNGNSASASEIIAGAVQDNDRAKVMGTRSFGKGSVQEVRSLRYGGGTLKYTTAHYYLPSGRNLNRNPDSESWGVDPDPGLVIPVSDEDYIASIEARRDFEIIRVADDGFEPCVNAAWIREHLLDDQLATAIETLVDRVRTGAWSTVTEEEPGEVAFGQELRRATRRRAELLATLQLLEERIDDLQMQVAEAELPSVLPRDLDLLDGTIQVADREGNLVGLYRIEGGNVALALNTLALTPLSELEEQERGPTSDDGGDPE